jgi:hypothetical protein
MSGQAVAASHGFPADQPNPLKPCSVLVDERQIVASAQAFPFSFVHWPTIVDKTRQQYATNGI